MTPLYLDTETFCELPITVGTHKYAEKVKIIMWQWAIGDGEVHISENPTTELYKLLKDDSYELVMHNSAFDRTVIRHSTGLDLPLPRIFDTMACALAHALPGSLEALCELFKIPQDKAKDKDGKRLINLFCKPQINKAGKIKIADSTTHVVEWANFCRYGELDIISMREIYKRLPKWNFKEEHKKVWELDQIINDRGFCIDIDLMNAAIIASDREAKDYSDQVFEKTLGEVTSTSCRDKLIQYMLEEYGILLADLTAGRLNTLLEEGLLPQGMLELLGIRLEASKTSIAKYKKVARSISADGRLKGTLQFCGASRTGRWSGRLFQPQNLPRSDFKNEVLESRIAELKANAGGLL